MFVDLGGAEMNAEMAIEMLAPERGGRVRICNAPVVEGAVVAATEASGGAALEAVCAAAEEVGAVTASRAEVTITHPTGLHARPAVKLTKLAKAFPADDPPAAGRPTATGSTPRASSR